MYQKPLFYHVSDICFKHHLHYKLSTKCFPTHEHLEASTGNEGRQIKTGSTTLLLSIRSTDEARRWSLQYIFQKPLFYHVSDICFKHHLHYKLSTKCFPTYEHLEASTGNEERYIQTGSATLLFTKFIRRQKFYHLSDICF